MKDSTARAILKFVGIIGLLLDLLALLVVLINRQLRHKHIATMVLFFFNSVQVLVVFSSVTLDIPTSTVIMPYIFRFVNTGYNMAVFFIVLERLMLVHICLNFRVRHILINKRPKKFLLLISLATTLNVVLTLLVKTLLPVTVPLTVIIVSLYIKLLSRISSWMKKSSIARQHLRGTARNYITAVLVLYLIFSVSRDVAAPLFLKLRNRFLKKVTGDCGESIRSIKPLLIVHSLHWIIDPIVYFFYHKASRQTCKKIFRRVVRKLGDLKTQIDILIIVYCPCDCPVTLTRRRNRTFPSDDIYYIRRVSQVEAQCNIKEMGQKVECDNMSKL